jgi:uracil-DNA glycosylase
MAVYIIGQAASRENQGMQALSGRSGRRIAEWAQIDQVWDLFHTMNLIREYPGRKEDGKAGDNFSMERAHRKAMVLLDRICSKKMQNETLLVLLGANVGRAFNLPIHELSWYQHVTHPTGVHMVVVPHPSGANRIWNDPANVDEAKLFWRTLALGLSFAPYQMRAHNFDAQGSIQHA